MEIASRFEDKQATHGYLFKMYEYKPRPDITLQELARIIPQLIEKDIDWMAKNKDLRCHFSVI